jgi:hypothetical protein
MKMWVQKDKLTKEISWSEVLDWVVIDGILWIEMQEKEVKEVCIVQS